MSETRIHWADSMTVDDYRQEVASIIRERYDDPRLANEVLALSDKHMLLKHSCMAPDSAALLIVEADNFGPAYTTCVSCERLNIPIIDNGAPSLCEECEANAGDIIEDLKTQLGLARANATALKEILDTERDERIRKAWARIARSMNL